ncbi:MAG TPA: glycoside hydrolase domain-containing protein [Puia sp.]|nr:glycoside hydrolase domain-containing protein [Puia sp.]
MQKIAGICFSVFLFCCTVTAQELPYSVCKGCWNPDSLGNQRVVVRCPKIATRGLAEVEIPWRRHDDHPEWKRIIVQDSATGERIRNVRVVTVTKESGDIYFEAVSGPGTYFVYYLPYRHEGRSNYPKGIYWRPDSTASEAWLKIVGKNGTRSGGPGDGRYGSTRARATGIQSIDAFDEIYPMEVTATSDEVAALKAKYPGKTFLLFPENRTNPIRMLNDIPHRWITAGPGRPLADSSAKPGEYYAYQLGLYALKTLTDVKVRFGPLQSNQGSRIAPDSMTCINTDGVSYDGRPFIKQVDVPGGRVQPLWCVVRIPDDASGTYSGTVSVAADGRKDTVTIGLKVQDRPAPDHGVGIPRLMTRLPWLNSRLAQENTVIAPYTPLEIVGDTVVRLLGRDIRLNPLGFPEQIRTFFAPEMTEMTDRPTSLLAEGIHFHLVRQADGRDIRLQPGGVHFVRRSPGTVSWEATGTSDTLKMQVGATLEFDGFLSYTVRVIALENIDLNDIAMHIPFRPEAATYMMGLGKKGGYRPDSTYRWKWDVANKNQDGAWIGTVNAGLQYSLRDERYVRPLNTNFYLQKPLIAPTSWANKDKGGIDIGTKGRSVLASNYSGPRQLRKGDTLYYNFNLLITPFHTLNTDFQWATRFYHRYNDLDSIKATGATVVNIHHATPINPWINYPFIEWQRMRAYIDSAHRLGLKVKIYNTVRELSDHAYELFALRSLGSEIYSPGPGGGFSWLQEHVADNYIPAWFVPEIKDAAMVNSGMSRWHNYYVEGMNWLVQQVGIDGIYLDDVAFDRVTMKRIKRVLTANGHPGIIDLHSANQYNPRDGFNNSANLYMEHFPYLNRLWFGEYFDYEQNPPDFFLTEVSGIPFGLMGEMLEGGGNPWRGMVYGMTNRMPWTENADPRPIWNVWDHFGMQGTKMAGYWSPSCPVKTDNPSVLATVYIKKGAALVAIASWANQDTTVKLQINWGSLGIDPAAAKIDAPEVANFQPARTFTPQEAIPVQKGKGWLLIIRPRQDPQGVFSHSRE